MSAAGPRVDVAVVGAGVIGLACAWWLREEGAQVLLADPAPGTGHSTGAGRMFRHAHRDPAHAALAVRAGTLWDTLSDRLRGLERPLLARIGALHAVSAPDDLAPLRSALDAIEVGYEVLDAPGVRERWPGLAIDPPAALHDPAAGRLEAAAAIAALRRDLRATLAPARVARIRLARSGAVLETDAGRIAAGAVVVCAGLETRHLVRPLGIDVRAERPLAATRLTFVPLAGSAPDLPCVHERSHRLGERVVYLFPGEWGGVSIGLESLPEMLTPALKERIRTCLERALPGRQWAESGEVAARLEVLDDADHDRIEIHRSGPVWAIAGWNLFKHAPAIGEGIAAIVASRDSPLLEALPGERRDDAGWRTRRGTAP